jgi:diguanylate cyclase (GGDEF)-like protein
MGPKSLRAQILVLVSVLVVLTAILLLVLILHATSSATAERINKNFSQGAVVFKQLMLQRKQQLRTLANVLVADFGFKEAVASGDRDTLHSMLQNHQKRIGADLVLITNLDGQAVASSAAIAGDHHLNALKKARFIKNYLVLQGQVYQVVILPVKAPGLVAYAIIGFNLDKTVAQNIAQLSQLDVSFRAQAKQYNGYHVVSTLEPDITGRALAAPEFIGSLIHLPFASRTEFASRHLLLDDDDEFTLDAVLSASLQGAYAQFSQLRNKIMLLTLAILAVAVLASLFLAHNLTRPLHQVVTALNNYFEDNFSGLGHIKQTSTEIVTLCQSFFSLQKKLQEREGHILHHAQHDALTGMLNRGTFSQRLAEWLDAYPSDKQLLIALNIQSFKQVNDSFGPNIGDACLAALAERLRQALPHALLGRMGGDEFIVLTALHQEGLSQCRTIVDLLHVPYLVQGLHISLRFRVAYLRCPDQASTGLKALSRVSMALEQSRRLQQPLYAYKDQDEAYFTDRIVLIEDLRRALNDSKGQLNMHYQPKMQLHTAKIARFEALIRWIHPVKGFIPPDYFIALAEQSGLIKDLTLWVLHTVIEQIALWRDEGEQLSVAVNISAQDLANPALMPFIQNTLARHGLDSSCLCLELTERDTMDDNLQAQTRLQAYKDAGFYLSIDDYGIGYSSLSKLKQMPVHEIKIDKHFVLQLDTTPSDQIIVKSTIELAHNFSLMVVAEGVENQAAQNLLRLMGCDYMQGYHLAKPLPAEQVLPWLKTFRQDRYLDLLASPAPVPSSPQSPTETAPEAPRARPHTGH